MEGFFSSYELFAWRKNSWLSFSSKMNARIKCPLKSLNEKSKYGTIFYPSSFSAVWALRMRSLIVGGMSGDFHCVEVHTLLTLSQLACWLLWRVAFGKKKALISISFSMGYFSHTKYIWEREAGIFYVRQLFPFPSSGERVRIMFRN